MDIKLEVGDRYTYKSKNEPNYQAREKIITNEDDIIKILNCIKDKQIEILKIERPKYEVIEEKKELLTFSDKEMIKKMIENVDTFSCENVNNFEITPCNERIICRFYNYDLLISEILVNVTFENLEFYTKYSLSELRIGG